MATEHYDAVVIGAGQGGMPLARALAGAGRKTAIIEREHVGGTCINEGCTPTKTMVASARVAYLARRETRGFVRPSSTPRRSRSSAQAARAGSAPGSDILGS